MRAGCRHDERDHRHWGSPPLSASSYAASSYRGTVTITPLPSCARACQRGDWRITSPFWSCHDTRTCRTIGTHTWLDADTHFIQNVMVHSGFEVIFSTGPGVLLVCGDPLVFLLRARSSLCRSSLPRSSLSRSSLPRERRPGPWATSPWRSAEQPSPS